MFGRTGLDRFKKAESVEPFSVALNAASKTASQLSPSPRAVSHSYSHQQPQYTLPHASQKGATDLPPPPSTSLTPSQVTQIGGGQSTWQPPDWAIEPRTGLYYLEVLKDGQVLDRINLDRRKHIFGRQFQACDFVLDHQSVSRQHAAVVPHRNGSIYVIDLGSAHGTFVANERLMKDTPVEFEVGQSLRFAASTRTYVLRKNEAALFPSTPAPTEISLPPPPDPSDEEAVVAYNTLLNRYGIAKSGLSTGDAGASISKTASQSPERPSKRMRKNRVAFRDQVGGELVEVVGVSDGADVETEPGPLGLKEGSLVGKYESLVQITVIPKGKEHSVIKEDNVSPKGVTDKLQEVLNKVKNTSTSKSNMYDDLYGDCFAGKVGSSWAYSSNSSVNKESSSSSKKSSEEKPMGSSNVSGNSSSHVAAKYDDDDDLFGE